MPLLVMAEPDPTGDVGYDALLAAIAEDRCVHAGIAPPRWVHRPHRFLDHAWWVSSLPSARTRALVHTPASYRRRGRDDRPTRSTSRMMADRLRGQPDGPLLDAAQEVAEELPAPVPIIRSLTRAGNWSDGKCGRRTCRGPELHARVELLAPRLLPDRPDSQAVVVADEPTGTTYVVTAYRPTAERGKPGFRHRKEG